MPLFNNDNLNQFASPFLSGPHNDDDERIYHAYYQWVPLMLFFQAMCFYAPHWIWKQLDDGKIKVKQELSSSETSCHKIKR
jgi:hypothetical protein